ncbi:MAG TPA: hypothetical protein PKE29_07490 [Phycisphaerales bacterium]|nr:hypothetical protein [Phycisphaerales bacterium]
MPDLSPKKPIGLVLAIVCGAVALSALAGAPLALFAAKPLYFLMGFEVVILVAGVFGVLAAMGRFAEGPGLTLLCVAAIVAIGSLLGDQTAKLTNPLSGPIVVQVRRAQVEWDVTLFFALRLVAAGLIGVGAGWVVLARRPRESAGSLVRGLAALGAFVAIVGGGWALRGAIGRLGPFVATLVGLAAAVAALGLLAAGVHFIVRAFEFGRIRESATGKAAKSA